MFFKKNTQKNQIIKLITNSDLNNLSQCNFLVRREYILNACYINDERILVFLLNNILNGKYDYKYKINKNNIKEIVKINNKSIDIIDILTDFLYYALNRKYIRDYKLYNHFENILEILTMEIKQKNNKKINYFYKKNLI